MAIEVIQRRSSTNPNALPMEVLLIKRHSIPHVLKVERNIDDILQLRIRKRDRCSVCKNHETIGRCDCALRYSNIGDRRRGTTGGDGIKCRKHPDLGDVTDITVTGRSSRDGSEFPGSNGDKREIPVWREGEGISKTSANGTERDESYEDGDGVDNQAARPANKVDVGEGGDRANTSGGRYGEKEFEKAETEREQASKSKEDWAIKRKKFFRAGDLLKVHILLWENNNTCWIRLNDNASLFERIHKFLNENYEKYPEVENPDINEFHLIEHQGLWYRGKITGCQVTRIRCVDTGVQFCSENVIFRELDPRFARLEGLAFKVYISEDSLLQEPVLGLTEVRVTDLKAKGIYEVKIVGDIRPSGGGETVSIKAIQLPKSSRRNVTEGLVVGMRGLFVSMDVQDKAMVGCLVPDELEEAVVSYRHVRSLWCLKGEGTRAEVGDFVLAPGKRFMGWRGVVKSKSPHYGYEVNLVDMGFTFFAKKVYKMPARAGDLLDLAAKVKITAKTPNSFTLLSDYNYYFEVKEKLYGKKWLCVFKKDYESEEYPAEAIVEQVHHYSHRISYVPFDSGCHVRISALGRSEHDFLVYVRRMDEDYYDKFLKLCDRVQKLPDNNDSKFWNNISPGDMVAAKYNDKMYYRALVLSRNNDTAMVVYLDYGNEQTVRVRNLKPLPDFLIKEPVYAVKVSLIAKKNATTFIHLQNLMRDCRDLILYYPEEITDGVVLVDKAIHDIHPQIFENLSPKPSRYIDKFTRDFFGDSVYSVGVVQNFVVLFIDQDEFMESGTFWAANPNHCALVGDSEEVNRKIGEYCQANAAAYSPRNGELCFAFFQDDWYRAFATDSQGEDFQIFFVDYGNISFLRSSSIRKMKREFFTYPPLAMKCILEGFDALQKSEIIAAYKYLREKVSGSPIRSAEILNVTDVGCIVFIREVYVALPGC